jgi:hypothetical protein
MTLKPLLAQEDLKIDRTTQPHRLYKKNQRLEATSKKKNGFYNARPYTHHKVDTCVIERRTSHINKSRIDQSPALAVKREN